MSDELSDEKASICSECRLPIVLRQNNETYMWHSFDKVKFDGTPAGRRYVPHVCNPKIIIETPTADKVIERNANYFQKANELLESGKAEIIRPVEDPAIGFLITEVSKVVHLCEEILKEVKHECEWESTPEEVREALDYFREKHKD